MQRKVKGAVLIYSGKNKDRQSEIQQILKANNFDYKENNPDIKILKVSGKRKSKSIGIGKIRETIKFLGQKPYMSKRKFVVIQKAHLLTRQAQNALLKTLEEPPPYATILLETQNKNELLDTVLSRCQQIKIKPTLSVYSEKKGLPAIKNLSEGKKLELAEKLSKKSTIELLALIERWIENERVELKKTGKSNTKDSKSYERVRENLRILETVRKDLNSTNVNTQLALEFLLLKLS